MLPSERPTGPIRRALHYLGLANAADERLRTSARESAASAVASLEKAPHRPADPLGAESEASTRRAARKRAARTTLAYFGLADDPDLHRSRYGNVSAELDGDVDALQARVTELEARLEALERGERAHGSA